MPRFGSSMFQKAMGTSFLPVLSEVGLVRCPKFFIASEKRGYHIAMTSVSKMRMNFQNDKIKHPTQKSFRTQGFHAATPHDAQLPAPAIASRNRKSSHATLQGRPPRAYADVPVSDNEDTFSNIRSSPGNIGWPVGLFVSSSN